MKRLVADLMYHIFVELLSQMLMRLAEWLTAARGCEPRRFSLALDGAPRIVCSGQCSHRWRPALLRSWSDINMLPSSNKEVSNE